MPDSFCGHSELCNLQFFSFLSQNPQSSTWKDPALSKLNRFCRDSRGLDQWVPVINLPKRWTESDNNVRAFTGSCTRFVFCFGWSLMPLRMRHEGIYKMQWMICFPKNPVIRSVGFVCPVGQVIHDFTSEQEEWLSTVFAVLPGSDKFAGNCYRKLNHTCWIRVLRVSWETGVCSTGIYSMKCDQTVGGQMDC